MNGSQASSGVCFEVGIVLWDNGDGNSWVFPLNSFEDDCVSVDAQPLGVAEESVGNVGDSLGAAAISL